MPAAKPPTAQLLRVVFQVEREPLVDAALDLLAVVQHALDVLPAHEAQPVRDRLDRLAQVFTSTLAVHTPPTKPPAWKPENSSTASASKPRRKRRPTPEK